MVYRYEDADVHYETSGSGPAVILLHGWGCSHAYFAPLMELLSEKYTVYALDLPGFGDSPEPSTVWGVEDYVRMLEGFVDAVCPGTVSLVGHSFGGRMAILYASRHPVGRLVLTDAAGLKPKRPLKYYIKVYSYKTARFFLLKVLRRQDLFERYRTGRGSSDYQNASPKMKSILSKVVNEDFRSRLPYIQAPTLLFWGEQDTATPLSDAKEMEKRIPDAGLVSVPGAGHFAFVEYQPLFLNVMKSFFNL